MTGSVNLAERIREVLQVNPAADAVEYSGVWHSWAGLAEVCARIESLLLSAGVPEGAPVGVLSRNRPWHVAAYLALILGGRTIVTLNPMQPAGVVAQDVRELRLPAVIAEDIDWSDALESAARDVGSAGIALRHAGGESAGYVEGLEKQGSGPHRAPMPGIVVEMLTSGTTGRPKRIRITTASFTKSLEAGNWSRKPQGEDAPLVLKQSPSILFVPMLHISGFYRCIFAFFEGRPTVLLDKFTVESWRQAVRKYRPKNIGLPPTALRMILDADVPADEISSLVAVTVGTAPLDTATREAFEERYGIPVLCNYGATEFIGPVTAWTLSDHRQYGKTKSGSVGRPIRGVSLRVVDPANGEPLADGETGLLEVRSDRFGEDADWIRTTDMASLDEQGFLFMRGRADGAIIRGGFKVLPEIVAETLQRHPQVKEAAVAGLADERLGAVPVAAVELVDGGKVQAGELLQYAREHLAAYQIPVDLKVVRELPRTPSMKVSLPGVRALFEPDVSLEAENSR